MAATGDKHPGTVSGSATEQTLGKPDGATTDGKGSVADQVSNDMSDAKETPEDTVPKDNSHNFT